MKCAYPRLTPDPRGGGFGTIPTPCGQCTPCRINRKREWTSRLILENLQYTDSSFWTLTYRDDCLPMMPRHSDSPLQTLFPPHLQSFLKRLRTSLAPVKFRFFAVGEYGDETHRPHYHLILFNYPPCHRLAGTKLRPVELHGIRSMTAKGCCPSCDLIQSQWSYGHVKGGRAEDKSLQYCAGYVVKKITKNYPGLEKHHEFARMSLRPGIGVPALPELASIIMQFNLDKETGDVPSAVRIGKKILPLGRTLRQKLRQQVGLAPTAPSATLDAIHCELSPVREAAFNASSSLKGTIIDLYKGTVQSIESRARIYKKRTSL
ncbi:MAG: replication initiator protein [Arizlama microvirus]|nr:MAG: replication initiator protein [Arizlama microvirus]